MNTPAYRTGLSLALLSGLSLFLVFSTGCGKEEAPQAAEPTVTEPTAKDEAPPTPAPAVAQEPAPAPTPEPIPEPAAPPAPVVAVAPAPVPAPTVAVAPEPAAKTAKDLLIGKWQGSEGGATITIEFKTDGTLVATAIAGDQNMSMTGSYSWTSDSDLSLTMTRDGQTHTEQATIKSIDANSLTMGSPNQPHEMTLTRVTG